jgi:hypothetical protein
MVKKFIAGLVFLAAFSSTLLAAPAAHAMLPNDGGGRGGVVDICSGKCS